MIDIPQIIYFDYVKIIISNMRMYEHYIQAFKKIIKDMNILSAPPNHSHRYSRRDTVHYTSVNNHERYSNVNTGLI